jgi:hypothetical protein
VNSTGRAAVQVQLAARALVGCGVRADDAALIMGKGSPEWYAAAAPVARLRSHAQLWQLGTHPPLADVRARDWAGGRAGGTRASLRRFVAQLGLSSLGVLWCSTHAAANAARLCAETTRNVSIVFAEVRAPQQTRHCAHA